MVGILQDVLPQNYNKVADFIQLGATPFAENALNLIHSPSGAGKSYNTVAMLGRDTDIKAPIIYLDFDGNQGAFKRYCHNYYVEFVAMNNFWEELSNEDKLSRLLKDLPEGSVVVLDSYAVIFDKVNVNVASEASKPMYELHSIAMKSKLCIIMIDHSTKYKAPDPKTGKMKLAGFKVEGSESGKFKACATVSSYWPSNWNKPEEGGKFVVEKSRVESIQKNKQYAVISGSSIGEKIKEAIEELEELEDEKDSEGWIPYSDLRDRMSSTLRDKLDDFEGVIFATKMGGARGTKKMLTTRPECLVEYNAGRVKMDDASQDIGVCYSTSAIRPYIYSKDNKDSSRVKSKEERRKDIQDLTTAINNIDEIALQKQIDKDVAEAEYISDYMERIFTKPNKVRISHLDELNDEQMELYFDSIENKPDQIHRIIFDRLFPGVGAIVDGSEYFTFYLEASAKPTAKEVA